MEQRVMHHRNSRGFVLPMVLFITAIGLLFGAGALLLFRHQCQLRIDRQHELEKVYSVRSALNYAHENATSIPDAGSYFLYQTGSDRNLGLFVKPVDPIFPDDDRVFHDADKSRRHFKMESGAFSIPESYRRGDSPGYYNDEFDYECGASGTTNLSMVRKKVNKVYSLALINTNDALYAKSWINIGMRGTEGWLHEDYGRRYYFWPRDYIRGNSTQDVLRVCLVRDVTNGNNKVGCQHGWPLSKERERALVLEIRPFVGNANNNAEFELFEYVCRGEGVVNRNSLRRWTGCPSIRYVGMQLAGNKISVFYLDTSSYDLMKSAGYSFLDFEAQEQCGTLTRETCDYFAKRQEIGGNLYSGTNTYDGKLHSPELRAVFESEARADGRGVEGQASAPKGLQGENLFTGFRVTPAYQYDVFIEHPLAITNRVAITNRATVAQRIYKADENAARGVIYTMLTYDTHGTDHKGFRYDEKHAGENQ